MSSFNNSIKSGACTHVKQSFINVDNAIMYLTKFARVSWYGWIVWLVASLFYGIEFLQRVSPTVMADALMQSFSMNISTFSFISSLYFYAYALAQIPVGLLLDRYGARWLLALSCAVISLGSLIFAIAHVVILLCIGRILIGFGSAFAFIGVLKLASSWFPEHRYPLMVGLTNSLGVAGAIFGTAPLARLVETTGWQNSMVILSVVGFVISLLIWLTVLDRPVCLLHPHQRKLRALPNHRVFTVLKEICSHAQSWITAIYAGLMVLPIIAFGELFAVPFLTRQYHFTQVMAAAVNSAIFIGIGVGGPVNGWVAGHFKQPKEVMLLGNIGALFSLTSVVYWHFSNNPYVIATLLFIFGFCTSSMLLAFGLNKRHFPRDYSGTVAAFTNMMIVVLGAIAQDVLGLLFEAAKSGVATANDALATYHYAFVVFPIVSIICLVLWCFIWKPEKKHT